MGLIELRNCVLVASFLLLLGSPGEAKKYLTHPSLTGTSTTTLKVLYWKVFEQYAQALQSEVPHLEVRGETYPPPRVNEILSNIVFVIRMVCIAALFGGPQLLQYLGIDNPPWIYNWAQENKMTAFLLIFLIGSQIENQLLSTGAFEVYLNDEQVWSKLTSGRLPSLGEMKELVDGPTVAQVDPVSIAS